MGDSIAYLCRDVSMGRGQNSNRAWRIGRDSNPRAASAATSLAKKRNRPDSATYPVSGQREIVYHGLTGVLSMRTGQNDHCARTCHGQVDDILLAASTYWKVVRIGKEPVPKTGVALRLGRSNRPPSANRVRSGGHGATALPGDAEAAAREGEWKCCQCGRLWTVAELLSLW